MSPPKALFVGDHIDQRNLGARAQSLALVDLLGERFEISDRVPATVVHGEQRYIDTILPSGLVRTLHYRRDRFQGADWIVRLEEALGAGDFVTGDPRESADNILEYADRYDDVGKLVRWVERADLVVINGEGSGIFSTPYRRDFFFYLAMAELGLRLDRPVVYTNTVLSDCPRTGRNEESLAAAEDVLARCTSVHVRDPRSADYAAETMPRVECRYVPDALFAWYDRVQEDGFAPPAVGDFAVPFPEDRRWLGRLDFTRPYVAVSGGSLTAHDPERAVRRFRHLTEELDAGLDVPVVLVQTCGGDEFLKEVAEATGVAFVPVECPVVLLSAVVAGASVLVSGRFHPSIVASLAGTPCVFLEAYSHKIHSLRTALGYGDEPVYSAFPTDEQADAITGRATEHLQGGDGSLELRRRVTEEVRQRAEEAARTPELIHRALDQPAAVPSG